MRARPFACRARGAMRIHPAARSSVRWRALSAVSSLASRALLLLDHEECCLPTGSRDRGRARESSRHVVEEVTVVGDATTCRVVSEEALEPGNRLGVEVVRDRRRQKQVGSLEQQTAQRDATALAPDRW